MDQSDLNRVESLYCDWLWCYLTLNLSTHTHTPVKILQSRLCWCRNTFLHDDTQQDNLLLKSDLKDERLHNYVSRDITAEQSFLHRRPRRIASLSVKIYCENVDWKINTNPEQQTDTLNWTICLCVSFNTYVSLRLNYFFHLVGFNVWIHKMHRVLSQSSGPEPLGCDSKLQKEWQAFLK